MLEIKGGLAISLVALLGTASCIFVPRDESYSIERVSPNGVYTIRLKESLTDPDRWESRLDLLRSGKPMIENQLFSSLRKWDGPFIDAHPKSEWVNDSVFMLGQNSISRGLENDVIEIENNGSENFRYFVVNTGRQNMYVLFNFGRGDQMTLSTQPQTEANADFSEFNYWGKMEQGRELRQGVAGFRIMGQYRNPAHYKITITDSGVVITSLEGFDRM